MLSDAALIESFIQQSIQRQDVLLANPNLRAQQVCNSNQLVARGEGLILAVNLLEENLQFRVKINSPHWEAINQGLVSHHFLFRGTIDRQGLYLYQLVKLPPGYQPNCTQSSLLWRAWWKYQQQIASSPIPLELLIRTRNTWYPIKKVECGRGMVYIQTLGSEIQIGADDLVIWLNKIGGNSSQTTTRARPNVNLRRMY